MKTIVFTAFIIFILVTFCDAQVNHETMLDSTFGNKGQIIYSDTNSEANTLNTFEVSKMAMQGNNLIVAADFQTLGEMNKPDTSYIFRLNKNGKLDSTFALNGLFSYNRGRHTAAAFFGLHCQSNGKIVALISSHIYGKPWLKYYYSLMRLNANGTIDSTFANNGFRSVTDDIQDMLVLPSDDIVIAATKNYGGKRGYALLKYTADGNLVARDSVKFQDPASLPDFPTLRLRITDNNKIVLASSERYKNNYSLVASLYQFNFSLEKNKDYGKDGAFHYLVDTLNYRNLHSFFDATTQSNGKMVIGLRSDYNALMMIGVNSNGTLNTSFGKNGVITHNYDLSQAEQLQTQKDDKIVASILARSTICVGRFTASGQKDSSFGEKGFAFKSIYVRGQSTRNWPAYMILQNDDKIVYATTGQSNPDQEGLMTISRFLVEKPVLHSSNKTAINYTLKAAIATISLSPNPVENILKLKSSDLSYKNISVVDATGKAVLKDGFAGSNHSINISGLNAGVYYLQLFSTNTHSQTIKFIKQ